MSEHITRHRDGFGNGVTEIVGFDDPANETGIAMGTLKLAAGETYNATAPFETAFLLMSGSVNLRLDNEPLELARGSLFDESASCLHLPAGSRISIYAQDDTEFTWYAVRNEAAFPARVFRPADVPNEHRGAGQVGGACLRFVRTIFDDTNSDANSQLVLGEVVTMPGRWSSYPPYHHAQPEIYHYRFTKPQGYGHAEHGESVFKVRQFDTVMILDGNDHAQAAAPGYGMYYSWVIRHLPDNRYTVPEFTEEHAWTMQPDAEFWRPEELDDG